MPENPKFPILVGPTGVGKSEVAFHLAGLLGAEIISADAFQVYRGLEVGTAQPPKEWRAQVPHHLVGVRGPEEAWNAVTFATEADRILRQGTPGGKRFLAVGGAGFYLRAWVEGPPEGATADPEVRRRVGERAEGMSNAQLHQWLSERDRAAAQRLHPNDRQRVRRALEKTLGPAPGPKVLEPLGKERVRFIGLERSRDRLDGMLRDRTLSMWRGGILQETEWLMARGLPSDHPLWGAIGYAEAAAHLKGLLSEDLALESSFRRTRQYAKRQWTWFKHQHEVEWVDLDGFKDLREAAEIIRGRLTKGAL